MKDEERQILLQIIRDKDCFLKCEVFIYDEYSAEYYLITCPLYDKVCLPRHNYINFLTGVEDEYDNNPSITLYTREPNYLNIALKEYIQEFGEERLFDEIL